MESSSIPESENYNIVDECELIADSRLKERDKFVEDTAYTISKSLLEGDVDLDEANTVMEQVGERYPLSLDEMATLIGKVHTANNTGLLEEPTNNPTDSKAWAELLARLNPKYTIFTDDDGDVSLGLKGRE